MSKRYIGKLFNLLLLAWFVLIPVFWQLDLSKGTSTSYDTFVMAPYAVFHLVTFYVLAFLAIYLNKLSLYHLLLLGLYFQCVQLANYPYLTFRDVYLHGAPVETILANGHLSYPKDLRPEEWPASFDLHGILTIVSGSDLIVANYILYLTCIVVFTLVLYCFAKMLERKGYRLACYGAILFQCMFFSHLFDNFHHFSREALGFTFFFLFLFCFARFEDLQGYVLQFLAMFAIITAHPFQSFAMVSFLFFYCVIGRNRKSISFFLLSAAAFVGWFLFNGSQSFLQAIRMPASFFSSTYVAPLVTSLDSSSVLPRWGVYLRDLFKYSLVALLAISALAAIVVFYRTLRHSENDRLHAVLSSLLPMSFSVLVVLLLLPDWQLLWSIPFLAFAAAFSSFPLLDNIVSRGKALRLKLKPSSTHALLTLLLLSVIVMSAAVMVLRFEGNRYLAEVTHPSELSSLSFLFGHSSDSAKVNIVSWRTSVYAVYFNYNSSREMSFLWYKELDKYRGNSSGYLYAESKLVLESQYTIRGSKDEYDIVKRNLPVTLLNTLDENIIVPQCNQVYSNGYYKIYTRQPVAKSISSCLFLFILRAW